MKQGYSGLVELDVSHRTGNVELTTLEVKLRLDRRSEKMHSFLVLETEHGWQGGRQFSNDGLIHARNVFLLRPALQPEIFIQSNYDRGRFLTYRLLVGVGIRSSLTSRENIELSVGTALMPEHEEYDLQKTNSHELEVTALRWSNYISQYIQFANNTRWTSTFYIQPDMADFKDIRLLLNSELALKLFKRFSLVIAYSLQYDSRPPDDVESLDMKLEPGVVLEF